MANNNYCCVILKQIFNCWNAFFKPKKSYYIALFVKAEIEITAQKNFFVVNINIM